MTKEEIHFLWSLSFIEKIKMLWVNIIGGLIIGELLLNTGLIDFYETRSTNPWSVYYIKDKTFVYLKRHWKKDDKRFRVWQKTSR